MAGVGVARSALTFAALLAQHQDLLETFLFQVCGELIRRHVRKGVFAFERDDVAARRLQAGDAGRIGAIDPEQRLFSIPADGSEPFDTLFVARERPTLEAVADAEPDVETRAVRRAERRRLDPEVVRRRDRPCSEQQWGCAERNECRECDDALRMRPSEISLVQHPGQLGVGAQ